MRRRQVPQWPFQPNDLVAGSQLQKIAVSSGILISSEISVAKKLGEALPPVHSTFHNGRLDVRLYRWEDIVAWLQDRGLSVTGPAPQRSAAPPRTASLHGDPDPIAIVDMKRRIEGLTRALADARETARRSETLLQNMAAKQPGLLSGIEILARSVPSKEITMPGVYFLIDGFEIVYVGQSITIQNRIKTHLADADKKFNRVFVLRCNEADLLRIEKYYIQRFQPKYNSERFLADQPPPISHDRYSGPVFRKEPLGRAALPGIDRDQIAKMAAKV